MEARSRSCARARAPGARRRWRCSASASPRRGFCSGGSSTPWCPTTSSPSTSTRELDALAAGPTASYAGSKRQINAWMYADLDAQLELEAVIQQEMANSDDFREGVTAFLEKRAPRFGR